ncbi:YwqJ-related putative deaminase [Nonomuraea sp. NPDC050643]|uniref:YwqJ-related putative deaminase n=1 Tax=Nonomuraea sp. NPDC050643 TaxID=3155660 RepID=UPI0033C82543
MSMPTEWQVLGLADDPAPGDPGQVRTIARGLLDQAALADHNTARLATVSGGGAALRMRGDYAAAYTEALGVLPAELAKLGKAYRGAGDALMTYAGTLEQAKGQAGAALRQGGAAHERYQGALREVSARLPAAGGLRTLSDVEHVVGTAEPAVAVSVRPALERARNADADRARARRIADEAAGLRAEAETRAVEEIERALAGSGIQNRSWLAQAWDTISTPFRSWDDFVNLARNIAMVAGIALLVIGTGGLAGVLLMGTVVVAGALVLGDSLNKYRQGKAGLGQVILDGIGMLPGGKGVGLLAQAGGVVAGLGAAAKAVRAGFGKLFGRAARHEPGPAARALADAPSRLRRTGHDLPDPRGLPMTRGRDGLIDTVDGRPVREYVQEVAGQRNALYQDLQRTDPENFTRRTTGRMHSLAFDRRTGQLFEADNRTIPHEVPSDLHPTLQTRLDELNDFAAEHPTAYDYGAGRQGGYPDPDMAGTHSEVVATNQALWARETVGAPTGEAHLSEIMIDNRRLYGGGAGLPAPCCPNCTAILGPIDAIPGRRTA